MSDSTIPTPPFPASPAGQTSWYRDIGTDRVFLAGVAGIVLTALVSLFEPYTIAGLPAHVLIVHGPIVLIPLAFLGSIAILFKDKWRERYGVALVILILLATAMTVVAAGAGEELRSHGIGGSDVAEHAEAGDRLRMVMFGFGIVAVAFLAIDRFDRRKQVLSIAGMVTKALLAILAIVALGQCIYTGHLGSKAVWQDRIKISNSGNNNQFPSGQFPSRQFPGQDRGGLQGNDY